MIHSKAESFGAATPTRPPFRLSPGRRRANFVAARLPETENHVRQAWNLGNAGSVGARVESQLPLDRYKNRSELDPDNAWRNLMLWEAAERLRRDFEASGMAPKVCGSFQPRVTGGKGIMEADHQIDAWKRYKKSMDSVSQTLRQILFYVAIAGEAANDWARRNAMIPQAGLAVLRLALAELADHYGLCKLSQPETPNPSAVGK